MKRQESKPQAEANKDHHEPACPDEAGTKESQDHKIELIQCESVAQDKEATNDPPKEAKTMKKMIDSSKLLRKLMIESEAFKKQ